MNDPITISDEAREAALNERRYDREEGYHVQQLLNSATEKLDAAVTALSSTTDFSKMFVRREVLEKAFREGVEMGRDHCLTHEWKSVDALWLQSNARKVMEGNV